MILATALLACAHWLNGVAWSTVALRFSPSLWRVVSHPWRKRGHWLDPFWAFLWGIAVNRLWLALHGTTFGETTSPPIALEWLLAWYVFAIGLGCIAHLLRSWYGLDRPAPMLVDA